MHSLTGTSYICIERTVIIRTKIQQPPRMLKRIPYAQHHI